MLLSFRAGFCSKTIIPDSEEHPLASSRAVPKAVLRWIRAYLSYLLRETRVGPETESAQSAAAGLAEPLTMREVEILRLIAAGMRNQEIADHLFISLSTVKRHIANAYGKLGVSHRTEAIARANELNLL